MNNKYNIGIIGGTGDAGTGLAIRLATAGHSVVLGSRAEARAKEVVNDISTKYNLSGIVGSENDGAALCEVVVIATPWDATLATLSPLVDNLKNKTVISMVNSMMFEDKEMHSLLPAMGSMALEIMRIIGSDKVTGAFHHMPAKVMLNLNKKLDYDVVVFGDNPESIDVTLDVVNSMVGLRGVFVGSSRLSFAVESFTSVLVSASILHKGHAAIKFTGIIPK